MQRFIFIVFLSAFAGTVFAQQQFVFCGSNKVIIAQQPAATDSVPKLIWEWDAHTALELPPFDRDSLFEKIDECKPVNNGREILITASTGGVALLRRSDKAVLFHTSLPQAHSAEMLPGNRIVVAGSVHEKGNCLQVYDLSGTTQPLFRDSLYAAHAVVWDDARQILYAIGGDELRFYQLENWSSSHPSLAQKSMYRIPEKSGHDLQLMPGNNQLIFTTAHNVWTFDIDTRKIAPYQPLEKQVDVKSAGFHPVTKQLIYTQSEQSWWAFHVRFLFPQSSVVYKTVHIYKARWID